MDGRIATLIPATTSSQALYEFLASKGFNAAKRARDKRDPKQFLQSSLQIADFCQTISALLPRIKNRATSPFAFAGNANFVGGPSPCGAAKCRLNTVGRLTKFAALYADQVTLPDPFQGLEAQLPWLSSERAMQEATIYGSVLILLKPLVLDGLISFSDNISGRVCSSCLCGSLQANSVSHNGKKIDIVGHLRKRVIEEINYELHCKDGIFYFHISGPEALIPHGQLFMHADRFSDPNIFGNQKTPRKLTKAEVKRIGVLDSEIHGIISDVQRQCTDPNLRRLSYLTERAIDFELLTLANGGTLKETRVRAATPFFHDVPILNDIPLDRLIRLRVAEQPAFEMYRDSVAASLTTSKGTPIGQQREIYRDVIRPELTKLENSIRRSKKLLLRSAVQDLVLAAGSVAIGLFGNFMPPDIRAGLSSLGGVHYTARLAQSMAKLLGEPKEAIDNRYYFLWKVKKKPRRLMLET